MGYYDKVLKTVGGQYEMAAFAKLFLLPGMHHCRSGPGTSECDMLPVMENWIEKGVSPAAVTAAHRENGTVTRTRPLCAHPQVATYVGSGSIDDAANFRCQVPAGR